MKKYRDNFSQPDDFEISNMLIFLDSISPSYTAAQIYTEGILKEGASFTTEIEKIEKVYQSKYYASNLMKVISDFKSNPGIGKLAPNFSLPSLDGKKYGPQDFKGKYLLVDFWASWCGPCRLEIPNVQKAYKKYKDRGFEVLGVSTDQSNDKWTQAVKDLGMNWTQVRDVTDEVSSMYRIQYIPTVYLLDKEGVIIADNVRGAKLEELLS